MIRRADLLQSDEVRDIFDRLAPRIELFRRRNSYYHRLLIELVRGQVLSGSRVLDLGCGNGDLLASLAPSIGVGIDISPAMVGAAQSRHPDLSFQVSNMQTALPDEEFDYIILCNSIGFLTDIQAAFRHIRGIATMHTRVVITHYNHLWEPLLKIAEKIGLKIPEPYQNWLSAADVANLLVLEGLEVVLEKQRILLPKYVPLLSALCNRFLVRLPGIRRLALVEVVVARPVPLLAPSGVYSCSVIVPARNERGTIEQIVTRVPEIGAGTEIVFVEGHSVDGTFDEIQRVVAAFPHRKIKILKQEGTGKADAVRTGFAHAEGDILMILDADMTVAPEELPKFYDALVNCRGELIMGSRLVYRMQQDSMRFLNLLGNKLFSLMFSFLLGQRVKDTLCGTKVLWRSDYERIGRYCSELREIDPFGDFELIFGSALAALRIVEIPVRYHARQYGETQISRFRHGLLLLRMVWWALPNVKFRKQPGR